VGNFDIQAKGMTRLFPSTGKWYDYFTGSSIDVGDLDLPLFLEPGSFISFQQNHSQNLKPILFLGKYLRH
jgi:hypothetical protein